VIVALACPSKYKVRGGDEVAFGQNGAILAAMKRISKHFDKVTRQISLNFAVFFVTISTFMAGFLTAVVMVDAGRVAAGRGDTIGLGISMLAVIVFLLNALIGFQMIQAVGRRLAAQSSHESRVH
jgi:hypothetical protein